MKTCELILLRLYLITLGRIDYFSRLLKRRLIKKLVKKKGYCASSKYWDREELK